MKLLRHSISILVLFLLTVPLAPGAPAQSLDGLASALRQIPAAGEALAADTADYLDAGGSRWLRLEARANTHRAGRQDAPALVMGRDGKLTVFWQSRRQEGRGHELYAQRFDPQGRRRGLETRLNQAVRPDQAGVSGTMLADGRTAFCWESLGQDGSLGSAVIRLFGAGLSPVSDETVANGLVRGNQSDTVCAALADGGFLAAWTGPGENGNLPRAWARRFDSSGRPAGPEFRLGQASLAGERLPSLVVFPDNGFAAVYAALDAQGRPAGVFGRSFAPDGTAGTPFKLNNGNDLGAIEPLLALSPDGRLLTAWLEHGGEAVDYDVRARLFRPDGLPLGPVFTVHDTCAGLQNGAAAAFLPDGRFVVAWNNFSLGSRGSDVMARFYTSRGTPEGDAFRFTRSSAGEQRLAEASGRLRLMAGDQGQLAVVWGGEGEGLSDDHGAFLTLLLPAPLRIAGDLDGDDLLTTADRELFYDVLDGTESRPDLLAAADLNGDARADLQDLALLPLAADPAGERRVRQSAAFHSALRDAAEARDRAAVVGQAADHRNGQLFHAVTDVAAPHQPPVWNPELRRNEEPFGGDPSPVPLADNGFFGVASTGWSPPDPHLAVGPNHVVVMTNGSIVFFTKAGTQTFYDEIEDSYGFWGSLGTTNFVFDPEVVYDPHSGRFMAMACERGTSSDSYFLLAVSDDSDPNGAWYKYRINATAHCGATIDSPNIAVDGQAVYLTADCWTSYNYVIYILNKTPLLSGGAASVTNALTITGPQSHGIPVTYGSAPAMYMIEHFESSSNTTVRLHAITNPLGAVSRVTYNLTVPSYSPPEDPPQLGASTRPETFDSRFWSCVWRNGSLWACHHIGSSRVLARWYQIDTGNWPASGTPTLVQSGTVDPGTGVRAFFNSISADDAGNAVMCFARSSSSEYISMARASRCADDPPGTMPDMLIQKASTAGSTSGRWGDYSAVALDPVDGTTFWMHHEYTTSSSSWNTWIASHDPECVTQPVDTLATAMACTPDSGTVPFVSQFWVQLENLTSENRRAAARIDARIASGAFYSNWRSGWTNLDPQEVYTTFWNQGIPALGTLIGVNLFTLHGRDVTPAPYNQPPYAPAGDTDSAACTVTALSP